MEQTCERILSLDGGGAWALIQACALGEIYGHDTPGRTILKNFNLVAANSGGSLVAGALVANQSPRNIVDKLFLDESMRRSVFVDKWSAVATRLFGIGPRYKTSAKLDGLRRILNDLVPNLGDTPLDKLSATVEADLPDFVFTSFDYDRQRAVFFRSNKQSLANSDPTKTPVPTLAEAIHASTNAPVNYFDSPAAIASPGFGRRRFWDGGVAGLNNPTLAAVIEAIANGAPVSNLKVVSIGTGSVMLPIEGDTVHPPLANAQSSSWLIADIKKLSKAIVDDPPDAATYIAFRILHGNAGNITKPRLVRLNPLIQPIPAGTDHWKFPSTLDQGYPEPDDPTAFEQLVNLDMDAVEQDEVELIKRFCDLWITDEVPNQPIQSRDNLSCKIGTATFTEAKAAVLAF